MDFVETQTVTFPTLGARYTVIGELYQAKYVQCILR